MKITDKDIKGYITNKIRQLRKPDRKPQIFLDRNNNDLPRLMITRYGNTYPIKISRRLAEELISAGFPYGN